MGAKPERDHETVPESPTPRLVYTHAPVLLGRLIAPHPDGWRVDLGTVQRVVAVDESVDVALLDEAARHGARVIVDAADEPVIVGVVATRRAVTIDREGRVDEDLRSFEVRAEERVLLKVPGAFVRAKERAVEVYGDRVLTRARDLAKILAAMIKLN
jgi:hypothetical protein